MERDGVQRFIAKRLGIDLRELGLGLLRIGRQHADVHERVDHAERDILRRVVVRPKHRPPRLKNPAVQALVAPERFLVDVRRLSPGRKRRPAALHFAAFLRQRRVEGDLIAQHRRERDDHVTRTDHTICGMNGDRSVLPVLNAQHGGRQLHLVAQSLRHLDRQNLRAARESGALRAVLDRFEPVVVAFG